MRSLGCLERLLLLHRKQTTGGLPGMTLMPTKVLNNGPTPFGRGAVLFLFSLHMSSQPAVGAAAAGNTCREWYWYVRRLEHWRFWQVVMADFFHVSRILEAERALHP